jgi:hypothetical protein
MFLLQKDIFFWKNDLSHKARKIQKLIIGLMLENFAAKNVSENHELTKLQLNVLIAKLHYKESRVQ